MRLRGWGLVRHRYNSVQSTITQAKRKSCRLFASNLVNTRANVEASIQTVHVYNVSSSDFAYGASGCHHKLVLGGGCQATMRNVQGFAQHLRTHH
jgi:hypothetical protein